MLFRKYLLVGLLVSMAASASTAQASGIPQGSPTPRPATKAEIQTFSSKITIPNFSVDEYVVAGSYALFGYNTQYTGGTALFQKNNAGVWQLIIKGGGQFSPGDMMHYFSGISSQTAWSMYRMAVNQDNPSSSGNPYHCTSKGVCTQSAPSGKPPK